MRFAPRRLLPAGTLNAVNALLASAHADSIQVLFSRAEAQGLKKTCFGPVCLCVSASLHELPLPHVPLSLDL